LEVWKAAENTRITINSMGAQLPLHGVQVQEVHPRRVVKAATRHHRAWLTILRESKRVQDVRRSSYSRWATGAAALEAITKQSVGEIYGAWRAGPCYVPFIGLKMAEPPEDHPVVSMLEALPADVAARYSDVDSILRPPDVTRQPCEQDSYAYDSVLGERREYLEYFKRPEV